MKSYLIKYFNFYGESDDNCAMNNLIFFPFDKYIKRLTHYVPCSDRKNFITCCWEKNAKQAILEGRRVNWIPGSETKWDARDKYPVKVKGMGCEGARACYFTFIASDEIRPRSPGR